MPESSGLPGAAASPHQSQQRFQQQLPGQPPHVTIAVMPASSACPPPALQLQASRQPAYATGPMGVGVQTAQAHQHTSDVVRRNDQHPQDYSPLKQGTRSGPWVGYASGVWLETEMRSEVDDLAHCVDKYASRRAQRRIEEERATMEAKVDQVRNWLTAVQGSRITCQLGCLTHRGCVCICLESGGTALCCCGIECR